jgi:hypothetical protein
MDNDILNIIVSKIQHHLQESIDDLSHISFEAQLKRTDENMVIKHLNFNIDVALTYKKKRKTRTKKEVSDE